MKMLSLADIIIQAQPSTPVLVPAVCQLINNRLMWWRAHYDTHDHLPLLVKSDH